MFERFFFFIFFFTVFLPNNSTTKSNCESVWVSSMTNAGMSFNSTLCRCHVTPSHTSRHHTQTTTQSSCERLVSRSVLESRVWSGPLRSGSVWVQDPQVRRHPLGAIVTSFRVQTRGRKSRLSSAQEIPEVAALGDSCPATPKGIVEDQTPSVVLLSVRPDGARLARGTRVRAESQQHLTTHTETAASLTGSKPRKWSVTRSSAHRLIITGPQSRKCIASYISIYLYVYIYSIDMYIRSTQTGCSGRS